MSYTDIETAAKIYTENLYTSSIFSQFYFHNIEHTHLVLKACEVIGEAEGVDQEDLEILRLASWFHDIGYCKKYAGHEEVSQQMAEKFLKRNEYPAHKIQLITKCIGATKFCSNPSSTLQKIMCDADLYHLSLPNYDMWVSRLRKEWEIKLSVSFEEEIWVKQNFDFLQQHQYHTKYGQSILASEKKKNIEKYELALNKVNLNL